MAVYDSPRHGSASTSDSGLSSTGEGSGSLADFQVLRSIGRGVHSQVFVAIHLPTGHTVALKRVEIFNMMDSRTRQDCIKEVQILQSVEHPCIVKCFNSFIQDNELIIVLEWAEAGDLSTTLRERAARGQPFEVAEICNYFAQISSAVKHMHDRRMMHRDLKPGNIFVTSSGDLKLGDFGLGRYFSSRTLAASTHEASMCEVQKLSRVWKIGCEEGRLCKTHSSVGTPMYMSPECIKGQSYEFSSDIWSLGCLLYELITLRSPFYKEGQTLYTLGKSITNCTYEPLPESVPASLRALVSAMMQREASARPTIHQAVDAISVVQQEVATQGGAQRSAQVLHSQQLAAAAALQEQLYAEQQRVLAEAQRAADAATFEQASSAMQRQFQQQSLVTSTARQEAGAQQARQRRASQIQAEETSIGQRQRRASMQLPSTQGMLDGSGVPPLRPGSTRGAAGGAMGMDLDMAITGIGLQPAGRLSGMGRATVGSSH